MAPAQEFFGEIRVASRIVDYLSSGLYKDPAACLKELINNSFDADATKVAVFVKPDADRIIIEDDGLGMTRDEFQEHFDHVSESHKRDKTDLTRSGRPKIGLIGIGFIAANEICDQMEVFSTAAGSSELMHVVIDFAEMRRPPEERRRKADEIAKADYWGEILEAPRDAHYTQLILKGVRGQAREILAGAGPSEFNPGDASLYGATVEDLQKSLASIDGRTWADEFDDYSTTMLQVALNVPVGYLPQWIPGKCSEATREVVKQAQALDFTVTYDGTPLRKPILFESSHCVCRRIDFVGDNVSFSGYLYAEHGTLKPQDLNGVLIRIRNAAVGEFRSDFLGFPSSRFPLFQRWVSGELYADDRLEEAMNIDRRTLRDTHPAYVELKSAFHNLLADFLDNVRKELHQQPAERRKARRRMASVQEVREAISKLSADLSPGAVQRIETILDKRLDEKTFQAALVRKYTAADVVRIATDAARSVLDSDDLERFLSELARRLR